jgi:hypothetical protein
MMLDELKQEGSPILFSHVVERDKYWKCIGCEDQHSKEVIYCQKCSKFRPMEMFKNILYQPDKISEFELNFIDSRRKMEKGLILDKDLSVNDEYSDNEADDKLWFMISSDWLFQWKCFISNKISSSKDFSQATKDKVV